MIERATALLEAVEELHRRGHQRLRITPYLAPSGLYWRLRLSAPGHDDTVTWSTSDPPRTADDVVAGHPQLVEAGRGEDPPYAAWVSQVAELARRGWLAYFFADWPTDSFDGIPLLGPEEGRPVLTEPPGGR